MALAIKQQILSFCQKSPNRHKKHRRTTQDGYRTWRSQLAQKLLSLAMANHCENYTLHNSNSTFCILYGLVEVLLDLFVFNKKHDIITV